MENKNKNIKDLLTAVVDRDFALAKSLSEGTDSAGGYLVPEEFKAQVVELASQYGVVRKYATVLKMGTDVLNIPKLATEPSASWVAEGGAIGTGQPSFGNIQLTAHKAGLIVPITNELLRDAKVDVQSLIAKIVARAIAKAEDEQGLIGNGSPFTGILNDSDVEVVTMPDTKTSFKDITADDLINLITAVPGSVMNNARFIMHRSIFAKIKTLRDGNGAYLFNPVDKTIWGYPVILSDVMPSMSDDAADKKFIIFGDLSYLYLGDREQMSVALADQASVGGTSLFETDQVAMRFVERVAIAVAMPKAFAVLKTAAA